MKVLLKQGAEAATPATILLPAVLRNAAFESLIGEAIAFGEKAILADADEPSVLAAVNEATREREDGVTAKQLAGHLRHLNKALADYETGSKIGLQDADEGVGFEVSEARRVNRAKELAKNDLVVAGPSIRPLPYMNARGKVVSIGGGNVEVELDPGDRDRIERARGRRIAACLTMPVSCVEKIV